MEKEQKIVVVCGKKNSGKTTLLAKLIEKLTERNVKVAVIKHDGHDFSCDVPKTDSYKLKEAGAYGTAVYSNNRIFVHKEVSHRWADEMIQMFPEADIIFIEGLKSSTFPKIEIIRKNISHQPVSNPEGRFLIVTDWEDGTYEEPTVGLDDIEEILKIIFEKYR